MLASTNIMFTIHSSHLEKIYKIPSLNNNNINKPNDVERDRFFRQIVLECPEHINVSNTRLSLKQ